MSAGAEKLAMKQTDHDTKGPLTVPPDSLISRRSKEEWNMWSRRDENTKLDKINIPTELTGVRPFTQDTVGAISMDAKGELASGVSR